MDKLKEKLKKEQSDLMESIDFLMKNPNYKQREFTITHYQRMLLGLTLSLNAIKELEEEKYEKL